MLVAFDDATGSAIEENSVQDPSFSRRWALGYFHYVKRQPRGSHTFSVLRNENTDSDFGGLTQRC